MGFVFEDIGLFLEGDAEANMVDEPAANSLGVSGGRRCEQGLKDDA